MTPTPKPKGTLCPRCHGQCAEFKRMTDAFTSWSCHGCGLGGRITGSEAAPAAAAGPKAPHRHWGDVARGKG